MTTKTPRRGSTAARAARRTSRPSPRRAARCRPGRWASGSLRRGAAAPRGPRGAASCRAWRPSPAGPAQRGRRRSPCGRAGRGGKEEEMVVLVVVVSARTTTTLLRFRPRSLPWLLLLQLPLALRPASPRRPGRRRRRRSRQRSRSPPRPSAACGACGRRRSRTRQRRGRGWQRRAVVF